MDTRTEWSPGEDQTAVRRVLRHWLPDLDSLQVLPATGGFSGAGVFRVNAAGESFSVRRWPADTPAMRIHGLHAFLAHLRQAGLPVARVLSLPATGGTVVTQQEIHWQLEAWLPGAPADAGQLTDARVEAAFSRLAQLHVRAAQHRCQEGERAWFETRTGQAPAIQDRLEVIDRWPAAAVREAMRSLRGGQSNQLSEPLLEVLDRYAAFSQRVTAELKRFSDEEYALHPCWRDLWGAHVLFSGETLSGFIDAAAARTEHPVADLSRLLGSWFGDNRAAWAPALRAYQQVRPLAPREVALLDVYDRSAVVLSGLHWVERWQKREIAKGQLPAVVPRLAAIIARLRNLA